MLYIDIKTTFVHFLISTSMLALAAKACTCGEIKPYIPRQLLSNEGIVALAEAGYDQDFLLDLIRQEQTSFDTSVEGLDFLAQHGISETLVRAMTPTDAKSEVTAAVADSPIIPSHIVRAAQPIYSPAVIPDPAITRSQKIRGAHPISVPAEIVDEVTLGINSSRSIVSAHAAYEDAAGIAEVGKSVLGLLMDTSIAKRGNAPPVHLTLLNDSSVNAFSTAGGQVYVNSGLLPVIGDNKGMWAAVVGHEVGHIVGHHFYKEYVRRMRLEIAQEALREEAANGNRVAAWAWLFSVTGGPLLNMKLSRGDELEADRMGMMMMAEAGFHPDFITILLERLQAGLGDQSKISTFLSGDHPRWNTREKKVKAAYTDALRVFEFHWPDAAASPGGVPPKS
jgi:Peptidase family M48